MNNSMLFLYIDIQYNLFHLNLMLNLVFSGNFIKFNDHIGIVINHSSWMPNQFFHGNSCNPKPWQKKLNFLNPTRYYITLICCIVFRLYNSHTCKSLDEYNIKKYEKNEDVSYLQWIQIIILFVMGANYRFQHVWLGIFTRAMLLVCLPTRLNT